MGLKLFKLSIVALIRASSTLKLQLWAYDLTWTENTSSQDNIPWIGLSNSTLKLAEVPWGKSRVIEKKISLYFVSFCALETKFFHKLLKFMLALHQQLSLLAYLIPRYFSCWEYLYISIFRSLPSLRMLDHIIN